MIHIKDRASKLAGLVGSYVDLYINPFEVIGDTYECNRSDKKKGHCDGVHLKGRHAANFLKEAGLLTELDFTDYTQRSEQE